jgi:hypothetical protein
MRRGYDVEAFTARQVGQVQHRAEAGRRKLAAESEDKLCRDGQKPRRQTLERGFTSRGLNAKDKAPQDSVAALFSERLVARRVEQDDGKRRLVSSGQRAGP